MKSTSKLSAAYSNRPTHIHLTRGTSSGIALQDVGPNGLHLRRTDPCIQESGLMSMDLHAITSSDPISIAATFLSLLAHDDALICDINGRHVFRRTGARLIA